MANKCKNIKYLNILESTENVYTAFEKSTLLSLSFCDVSLKSINIFLR